MSHGEGQERSVEVVCCHGDASDLAAEEKNFPGMFSTRFSLLSFLPVPLSE